MLQTDLFRHGNIEGFISHLKDMRLGNHESLEITGEKDRYRLIVRSWPGGPRPDYNHITSLTNEEAYAIFRNDVAGHLVGHEIEDPNKESQDG